MLLFYVCIEGEMVSEQKELEQCPLCGCSPKIKSYEYNEKGRRGRTAGIPNKRWWCIWCPKCGVRLPKRKYLSEESAMSVWNNRHSPDEIPEDVWLKSQISELEKILSGVPKDRVITISSITCRIKELKERLKQIS